MSFVGLVDSVIGNANDPYDAVRAASVDLDEAYSKNQVKIVTELREFVDRTV